MNKTTRGKRIKVWGEEEKGSNKGRTKKKQEAKTVIEKRKGWRGRGWKAREEGICSGRKINQD